MSPPRRTWVRRAAWALLPLSLLVALMLYALQRSLIFPAPPPVAPSPSLGALVESRTRAGRRVVALWSLREEAAPTIAYFHGNGAQLADAGGLIGVFKSLGCNVFCVEYPGYGPLSGDAPSEEALIDVADGAMEALRTRLGVPASRTVLVGQSLGTGVASALAARGAGARLVLISPFRSIPAVAAGLFPWLPVRALVRDRFDTESRAAAIRIPTLILHGTDDEVIPFAHGESLARRFPDATLVRIERGGHNDLWIDHLPPMREALRGFIAPLSR